MSPDPSWSSHITSSCPLLKWERVSCLLYLPFLLSHSHFLSAVILQRADVVCFLFSMISEWLTMLSFKITSIQDRKTVFKRIRKFQLFSNIQEMWNILNDLGNNNIILKFVIAYWNLSSSFIFIYLHSMVRVIYICIICNNKYKQINL